MADVKISDLAADSSPESTALIEIETAGGLSRKITLAQVLEASSHTHALGEITQSGATSGQVPTWSGSAWVPQTPSGASPGGSSTEVQYRINGSTFGGMAGTAWDNTDRSLTMAGATVTSSKPILNLSQTWNNAGVTFYGQAFNVTNTASASGSLLAYWQVPATYSGCAMRPDGRFLSYAGNAPSSGTSFGQSGGTAFLITSGSTNILSIGTYGINLQAAGLIGWSPSSNADAGTDLYIYRDAANTLAQRNGTNAQTMRVYGTFTDLSNRVNAALSATSTTVTLAAETAGTGADNVPVNINAAGTSPVAFGSPAQAKSYTVATVPSASASGAGSIIYVTDEAGGAVLAFSDATDWRRVTDRAVIS